MKDNIVLPDSIITDLHKFINEHMTMLVKKISLEFNIDEKDIINKCFQNTNFQIKQEINNLEQNNLKREDIESYTKDLKSKEDLKKYQLPKLKFICSEYKLKKTGNKNVLIDRIAEYLNIN